MSSPTVVFLLALTIRACASLLTVRPSTLAHTKRANAVNCRMLQHLRHRVSVQTTMMLALLAIAGSSACSRKDTPPQGPVIPEPEPQSDPSMPKDIKAFYFGHSLLAGQSASPNYHIPYNIGIFAAAKGHSYDTHGQLGWGTPLVEHWKWSSDKLADGPQGFASENKPPFYAGRNGKAELAAGGYNVVVFTDVNGNARGGKQGPVVDALIGLIQLAREKDQKALAVLYSVWNELPVEQQGDLEAVKKWRDQTLSELRWWENVADTVNTNAPSARLRLVPVSTVFAELAWDAANGRIPGGAEPLATKTLFSDEVHGSSIAYYAAAAALYGVIFKESPLGATAEQVQGSVSGATVDYKLPSAETARYIQQRAYEIVRDYPRAGVPR